MKGFSFFEICIVLLIVGILTSLAIPIYSQHVVKSHRLEAEITLKNIASSLEEFYITHNTYEGATLPSLGFQATETYTFQLASTAMYYQIEAIPHTSKDELCGTLTLNSLGEMNMTGTGNLKECW